MVRRTTAKTTRAIKTLRIKRADGFHEYHVDTGPYRSILDALEEIRSEQEPGLLYRHSCHHGSCGTCGVIANGKRVLACTTRLEDLEGPIELHPLSPFPVIGDLAIDPAPSTRIFPGRRATSAPARRIPTLRRHRKSENMSASKTA